MPNIGNKVRICKIEVKKLLTHLVIIFKKSLADDCIIDTTWEDISILLKSILLIYLCTLLYIFSIYIFKLCNKFEDSDIKVITPKTIALIITENMHSITMTALVFLVSCVFLFINFIKGSIKRDIINPIKKGR